MNGSVKLSRTASMILAASREIGDHAACFVGVGTPSQAAMVAVRAHAPNAFLLYESGALDTRPERAPLSVADQDVVEHSQAVVPVAEIFNYWLQGEHVDVGLLGAAEVDAWGNINSTVIGDYAHPGVRLPGAGGAPTIGGFARRAVVVTKHSRKALVEKVAFVTTPGWGPQGARDRPGMTGAGATTVVTDLGVFRLDQDTGRLELAQRHPGVSDALIQQSTGWHVDVARDVKVTASPSPQEEAALEEVLGSQVAFEA